MGYPYYPWVGLSMGLVALIAGIAVNSVKLNFKGAIYIKLAIVCVFTLLVCTIGINTTFFWLAYAKGVSYPNYLVSRLFVQGQIWNSLVNYFLLFVLYPLIIEIKKSLIKRKKQ